MKKLQNKKLQIKRNQLHSARELAFASLQLPFEDEIWSRKYPAITLITCIQNCKSISPLNFPRKKFVDISNNFFHFSALNQK